MKTLKVAKTDTRNDQTQTTQQKKVRKTSPFCICFQLSIKRQQSLYRRLFQQLQQQPWKQN